MNRTMDAEILALASAADGLAVTVNRTPIGRFGSCFATRMLARLSKPGCLPIASARSGLRAV
jgi:hypothetical protein